MLRPIRLFNMITCCCVCCISKQRKTKRICKHIGLQIFRSTLF